MSAHEAELMSTVANLKTELEKATASSVPSTKYMAVRGGCHVGIADCALMTGTFGRTEGLKLAGCAVDVSVSLSPFQCRRQVCPIPPFGRTCIVSI